MSNGSFTTALARFFGDRPQPPGGPESPSAAKTFGAAWILPAAVGDSRSSTGPTSLEAPTREASASKLTTLGPLGGPAEVTIDKAGWLGSTAATWSLDWAVRDSDGWRRPGDAKGVSQRLREPAVVETSLSSGGGEIVQRIAVAVVAGEPVAVIEIENQSPVAVAVAIAVRPFNLRAAGVDVVRSVAHGVTVDGAVALTAEVDPRSVQLAAEDDGFRQLLDSDDDVPTLASKPGPVTSTSGSANATLVWPLPHTATLRLSMPLGQAPNARAVVPGAVDVNRGWLRHLEQSMVVQVDDADLGPATLAAQRDVLARVPGSESAAAWMVAVAEAGFSADASRGLGFLDPRFDPGGTIFAIGRTVELGDPSSFGRAEAFAEATASDITAGVEPALTWSEDALEPLAIAAHELHRIAKRGGTSAEDRIPPFLTSGATNAAAELLRSIGQPDVAERVEQVVDLDLGARRSAGTDLAAGDPGHNTGVYGTGVYDFLQQLQKAASPTWAWSSNGEGQPHDLAMSAAWLLHLRRIVIEDDGHELRILPAIPLPWRGRNVSAYRLPIARGSLSFGLRWHGPRAALLWEVTPHDTEATAPPVRLSVPGISADWSSESASGEELLPDPGWT